MRDNYGEVAAVYNALDDNQSVSRKRTDNLVHKEETSSALGLFFKDVDSYNLQISHSGIFWRKNGKNKRYERKLSLRQIVT